MWKITKFFGRPLKPFFSNKEDRGSYIQPVECNDLFEDYQKIAEGLNNFYKKAVSNLKINENTYIINHNTDNNSEPVDKDICKYKFHPNILLIKNKLDNQETVFVSKSFFCFRSEGGVAPRGFWMICPWSSSFQYLFKRFVLSYWVYWGV